MSRFLDGMRAAFHEDLLIWQIQSLRELLMDAERREPVMLERGSLDAQLALLLDLIKQAMKRACEQSDADGNRGVGGRPVEPATLELRTFAFASVDALTAALGGHGHKAEAQRQVASIMSAAGVTVSDRSYFDSRNAKQPAHYPVELEAIRRVYTERLMKAHARGDPLEAYIRAGIGMRCRVLRLLERGGVAFDTANRVVP